MQGMPKHLNSRQDYEYVRAHFPPEQWKPLWRTLLMDKFAWCDVARLEDGEEGITDEQHKVVEAAAATDDGLEMSRMQLKLEENSAWRLKQLGFTEAEVLAALNAPS